MSPCLDDLVRDLRAVRDATRTIPIVALDFESDPVEAGFARSFAQPGGNITGCFLDQPGLTGKWLDLIVEAVPGTRPVGVLVDLTTGPWQLAALKASAAKLGIKFKRSRSGTLGKSIRRLRPRSRAEYGLLSSCHHRSSTCLSPNGSRILR